MTWLRRLASIVRVLMPGTRADREMDDELRGYLEMAAAAHERDGLSPDEAMRRARIEIGGVEQVKEQVRRGRHGGLLDEGVRDLRYAVRMLVRTPSFTLAVVLTLALGIGANVAIFSLIDLLMLRWLPVHEPQRLVQVALGRRGTEPGPSLSYPIVRALAEQRDIFDGVAGFSRFDYEVGPAGSVALVRGAMVSGGYYATLGLEPVAGRLLQPRDDEPGAAPAAVLSHRYWLKAYGGAPAAIGQTMRVNGIETTIVGVSPPGFVGATVGSPADITLAVATLPQISPSAAPLLQSGNFWLRVLARPQPGVSPEQARARLDALWPRIADPLIAPHWPASMRRALAESVFTLTSGATGWTYLRGIYRKPLAVLMGLVALVLLIACANVASLLLARGAARRREMAVRLALGASRFRIVRQLLLESAVLSVAGAAVGLGLAWQLVHVLVGMLANAADPLTFDLSLDAHVLGFTTAAAVATTLLFGVIPASTASGAAPAAAVNEHARGSAPRARMLSLLVCGQVAMAMVLIAGAGLFVRTLRNLERLDPGFAPAGVLIVPLDERRIDAPEEILAELRRVPGVAAASLSTHTPLSGSVWSDIAVAAGQPLPERDTAHFVGAAPQFFTTMGMSLLSGRDFADADTSNSLPVAIVNEAYAKKYLGGGDPVGRRLAAKVRGKRLELTVIGLARNASLAGLRAAPPPTVYVAFAQLTGDRPVTIGIRTMAQAAGVTGAVRTALQARFPERPIEVQALTTQVQATILQERLVATLAAAFGLVALALVAVGVYGLVSYAVAQRTKEMGIRIALGARPAQLVGRELVAGARLCLLGIALGLPAAWLGSRTIESMLFGLTATDAATLAGAAVVLAASVQLAAYLPARRSARIDPLVSLRHD